MDKYSLKPRIFRIMFKNISEDYVYNKPIIIAKIKIIIVVQESLYILYFMYFYYFKEFGLLV